MKSVAYARTKFVNLHAKFFYPLRTLCFHPLLYQHSITAHDPLLLTRNHPRLGLFCPTTKLRTQYLTTRNDFRFCPVWFPVLIGPYSIGVGRNLLITPRDCCLFLAFFVDVHITNEGLVSLILRFRQNHSIAEGSLCDHAGLVSVYLNGKQHLSTSRLLNGSGMVYSQLLFSVKLKNTCAVKFQVYRYVS